MPFWPKSFNSASICSHVIDSLFTVGHLRKTYLLLLKLYPLHDDGSPDLEYLPPRVEMWYVVPVWGVADVGDGMSRSWPGRKAKIAGSGHSLVVFPLFFDAFDTRSDNAADERPSTEYGAHSLKELFRGLLQDGRQPPADAERLSPA